MNTNYKYTTIVLSILLIVTYTWHWNDIFNHENKNTAQMMHQMPNGETMMGGESMDSMMMDMLSGMRGKSGIELEKVFLTEMIVHHQGAVDMANELLKDKTIRQELATFAKDIINAQTDEIAMQKRWLKNWFGITK